MARSRTLARRAFMLPIVGGGGGAPVISVTGDTNFGSTPVGTPVSEIFTIENTGNVDLELALPVTVGAGFTVTSQPASTSLAPAATTTFTVQASASSVATFNTNISITNNSSENPKLVAIMAVVTLPSGVVANYDSDTPTSLWEDSARTIQASDNADVIGSEDDISGNGRHITQATTINKPTLRTAILNSKPIVRFDGTDDFLANTSFPDFGDAYTVFAVARYDSAADANQGIMEVSNGTVNTGFLLFFQTATLRSAWRCRDIASNIDVLSSADIRDNIWRIHEGSNSGSLIQYLLNGVSQGTAAYTAPNLNTLNRLDVGRTNAAGFMLQGDIAQLIIFNRNLTAGEKTAVRNWLNAKWAVY